MNKTTTKRRMTFNECVAEMDRRDEVIEKLEARLAHMETALSIGTPVRKITGYPFPGEVRSVFRTRSGLLRYVIEATGEEYAGMLHIFSPQQIEAQEPGE